MKTYATKQELIGAIQKAYDAYDAEFDEIAEDVRTVRVAQTERTPSENIAYQIGWLTLLLGWERDEQAGRTPAVPAKGYKWNALGGLYQSFYDQYGSDSLHLQRKKLRGLVEELCAWIETLSDEELFEPGSRVWAKTSTDWPVYKWIHINSVAPFTNFRTKIRKWKKSV